MVALMCALGRRVLLWHRSENLAFVLVLGGAADITVGSSATCVIKGVLQVGPHRSAVV